MMKNSMIHTLFAVTAVKNWFVKQINFITVFLNEILSDNETVYMKQLTDYESKTSFHLICQLNQDLYDLKQSVKIWYDTLIKLLKQLDFIFSQWDISLWMHLEKKIYLILYIDDVKFIEFDEHTFDEINHQIMKHFQITDLDQIHHYLDMKIKVDHQS